MQAPKPTNELEARDRIDTIVDYLDTLLRALWEDLDIAGVTSFDVSVATGTACQDALRTISMAQELVAELSRLSDRERCGYQVVAAKATMGRSN